MKNFNTKQTVPVNAAIFAAFLNHDFNQPLEVTKMNFETAKQALRNRIQDMITKWSIGNIDTDTREILDIMNEEMNKEDPHATLGMMTKFPFKEGEVESFHKAFISTARRHEFTKHMLSGALVFQNIAKEVESKEDFSHYAHAYLEYTLQYAAAITSEALGNMGIENTQYPVKAINAYLETFERIANECQQSWDMKGIIAALAFGQEDDLRSRYGDETTEAVLYLFSCDLGD